MRRARNRLKYAAVVLVILLAAGFAYLKTHPQVFNESFWQHAHCIAQASGALRLFATDHHGDFPVHPKGYGNALLLLTNEVSGFPACLTGPGYDTKVFEEAIRDNSDVPEEKCGRVYIQGLREDSDRNIVILFDKLPTPGGDHCHFLRRLFAPTGREVLFVNGLHRFIRENNWTTFASNQVELLVKAGLSRPSAEAYYKEHN